ncbi:MAG: amino acid permease [Clostridia bacterium]|nr:amino acid permease [Clostridia bacterium]
MEQTTSDRGGTNLLRPYLSPLHVFALSVGSAIGWGSLIATGKTYLLEAGPLGSILGLSLGLIMMLMVSAHYHFLANRYPGTGGLYNYVKYVFGYDRAFLVAWFMFLVYISIFWANATAIPLFLRFFVSDFFRFGYLYTVFGYEVYVGEALITLAVMALVALLCATSKKWTARLMVILVLLFTVGITVCFAGAMIGSGAPIEATSPMFVPDRNIFRQVLRIAFLSPWAYIGFESVSHSAGEYKFEHRKLFRILLISVIVTTALYIFAVLLSASACPPGCTNWLDYISRLDEFDGIEGLPAFYGAYHYLGNAGVAILVASLLALVLSSLIGLLRALGRLCYAVAQDDILPARFSKLNAKQIPVNTILLVLLISLPIPFFGRTATGWIVDTTTIGATIIYGFVSAAALKVARREKKTFNTVIGLICMVILVLFMSFLLFPQLFSDYTIETESYVLMSAWSFLGVLYFHHVISKDHARNFGKAIIVWLALLAFIVVVTMAWVNRMNEYAEDRILYDIEQYVDTVVDATEIEAAGVFMEEQHLRLHAADNASAGAIVILFLLSLGVMLINHLSLDKWEKRALQERDHARTIAFTDPLTGVKSKHAFATKEEEIETLISTGQMPEFGIVVCDVNGLKRINDTLGHKAGDEYIRAACVMLCDFFKHSPVFRVGGDEFVVLLQGHDFAAREEILRDINALIEENIGSDRVVASLGLAVFDPQNDKSFYEVFSRADGLMYGRKAELKSMGAVTRE